VHQCEIIRLVVLLLVDNKATDPSRVPIGYRHAGGGVTGLRGPAREFCLCERVCVCVLCWSTGAMTTTTGGGQDFTATFVLAP
jgi:hypothetical protein